MPKLFSQRNLHPSGFFLILNFVKKTLIAGKCGANQHKTYVREGKGTKLLKPHRSYLSMASITFLFQSQAYLKILRLGMYSPLDLTSLQGVIQTNPQSPLKCITHCFFRCQGYEHPSTFPNSNLHKYDKLISSL